MQCFVSEMRSRGLVAQLTHEDEFKQHLTNSQTAYVGCDPTASSLHVGHLLPLMTLARWQKMGHRAIVLMGGGTAMIGDPTGKSAMRQMMSEEDINANIAGFKKQVRGLLDLNDPKRGIVVNNADWLLPIHYIPFLREIGSQFSVNRMLTADCFKSRLETGLSFIEFNYMLLQSYDFLHLFREEQCTVQLGGDDQWSNMLSGVDLVRRLSRGRSFCLTVPLLTTPDGKKMGKTEKGAVWLDPDLTPPFDYFQFWRNQPDEMVGPCLRYFTFLPMDEIERMEALRGAEINDAKVRLAFEATRLVHGEAEAEKAKAAAAQLFSGGSIGDVPEVRLSLDAVTQGIVITDLLVLAEIVPSKAEARRLIEQGGILINGEKVSDSKLLVVKTHFLGSDGLLLKKGKKHYYRLRI